MLGQDALESLMTWVRTHYFGKYAGRITDNEDPLNRGRLKIEVPDVFGLGTSVWALPCVPYAGAGVGFKALPEVGTNVWVEFEKGDISYPVWTGFFWGEGELPEEAGTGAGVKLWKTGAITIKIDDDAGELVISAADGATLTLSTEIKGEVSSSSVTIASDGVTTDAGRKIEVTQVSVKVNDGSLEVM